MGNPLKPFETVGVDLGNGQLQRQDLVDAAPVVPTLEDARVTIPAVPALDLDVTEALELQCSCGMPDHRIVIMVPRKEMAAARMMSTNIEGRLKLLQMYRNR